MNARPCSADAGASGVPPSDPARRRVLIAGCNGQLGQDCLAVMADRYTVQGADLPDLDITDPRSVKAFLDRFRPDVLINCAAYTDVDGAESAPESALRVNADGPRTLACAARSIGCHFIHVSTDYVFDGHRPAPEPYREDDPPNPLSRYGVTKLAGERAVAEADGRWAILRTAWLYGAHGRNFPRTILRAALRDSPDPLRVVNDQHGSPTWSLRLAQQLERVAACGATGLFHATAEGHGTWFDVAVRFLNALGVSRTVQPCTSEDYPRPAKRPHNSILENARLKSLGLNIMTDWREDLDRFALTHGERWKHEGA